MTGGTPRARAKRQQISTAARTLLLANGYARTSMDAVAAEARVSKQTLYAYFPSKEELLTAVLQAELGELTLGVGAPEEVANLDELRALLLRVVGGSVHALMRPDAIALIRLVIGEATQLAGVRELFRATLPLQVLGALSRLLAQADRAGIIAAPHPGLSARMLLGSAMTFIALDGWMSPTEPVMPDDDDLVALVDMFLRTVAR